MPWLEGKPVRAAAIAVAALAALVIGGTSLFLALDNRLSDAFVRAHAAGRQGDPGIVIVDIDEASFARMQDVAGKWPWPRSVHAELVAGIAEQGPKAIVFDIFFSDPDVFRPDADRLFNETLKAVPGVYLPMARLPARDDAKGVPIAEAAALLGVEAGPAARQDARVALLAPTVVDPALWRTGVINFNEDADGVGRRYYLWLDAYGWRIPSLPARVARDLGYAVPGAQELVLDWQGPPGAFRHVSYADLYEDFGRKKRERPADEFRDKIVIVGTAATGLQDLRVTPIASLHPGVEILATAIDNLKNGRAMRVAPPAVAVAVALALIAAMLFAFERRVSATRVGLGLAAATLAVLAAAYAAVGAGTIVPVVSPLAFAWTFFVLAALAEYLREKRSREQAVGMFSRFLNPKVVRDLVEQGRTPESMSGQASEITVLFSDIRGFTTLSETHSPEEIVRLLNRYFSRQVEVVFRHGGTLDKFIGDAIMAFWGAPVPDARHAEHAVAAALEMQQVLEDFKRELGAEAGDIAAVFDVGIGINTGRAVVGFIGARQKLDYTAIGDTVNTASRIEGLTKGVARILVSAETARAAADAFDFVPRGAYKVKGRAQEVELFEPRPKGAPPPSAGEPA